jgi:hypothetical protein
VKSYENAVEIYFALDGVAIGNAYQVLSNSHFALYATILSFYSHL